MKTKLYWTPGKNVEKAVRCCGCGTTISVAESLTSPTEKWGNVFACSWECATKYEQSPGRVFGRPVIYAESGLEGNT